mmetsp:Transcript_3383/g.8480  ORF Transcript_3383/g.8480 Transcript_3383/m.8480 type:complete len:208 (+) Transcript_3383:531-1154(+)
MRSSTQGARAASRRDARLHASTASLRSASIATQPSASAVHEGSASGWLTTGAICRGPLRTRCRSSPSNPRVMCRSTCSPGCLYSLQKASASGHSTTTNWQLLPSSRCSPAPMPAMSWPSRHSRVFAASTSAARASARAGSAPLCSRVRCRCAPSRCTRAAAAAAGTEGSHGAAAASTAAPWTTREPRTMCAAIQGRVCGWSATGEGV